MRTINRRVYFYKVQFLRSDTTTNTMIEVDNPTNVFTHISQLPPDYLVTPNRYLDLHDGNELLMQIDDICNSVKGQFAIKRKTKLPSVEVAGKYRPLQLDAQEGLAEIAHFIFYPDTGIMGAEFNYFGPRITRMDDYLKEKVSHIVDMVRFTPKLANDVRDTLKKVGRMTLFRMAVYADQIDFLMNYDGDLYKGFQDLRELNSGAQELEIILKLHSRKKSDGLLKSLLKWVPDFLGNITNRQSLAKLQVHAYDERINRTVPIDLLADKMVAECKVVTLDENSRAVKSENMYEAIESAYDGLREGLVHCLL